MIRSPLKKSPKPGAPKWALVDPSPPSIPVASSTSALSQNTPTCPQHVGTSSQQMLSFSAAPGSSMNYVSDSSSSSSDFELPE